MIPCEVCNAPLDTREAAPHVFGHRHFNSANCIVNLKAELAEWRTGKRRVYWRLNDYDLYEANEPLLDKTLQRKGERFMRITIGPRGNVRPWRKK